MANDYYAITYDFDPYTKVTSSQVDAEFAALVAAFDKLPSPSSFNSDNTSFVAAGGTANAIAIAHPITTWTTYTSKDGHRINIQITTENTGSTTLPVDGLTAKACVRNDGSVLQAGDLQAGCFYNFIYDEAAGNFKVVEAINGVLTDCETQASNASSSASAASSSASSASGSASAASAAKIAAEAAQSAAENAKTAAQAAQSAAETVYDNFDDRYLGQKSSDPTLDNDGDALQTGALYFNTTIGGMKVYTGSAWQGTSGNASDVTFDSTGLNTSATTVQEAVAAALIGRKNAVINGDFNVWQRGTSFTNTTTSHTYCADRWRFYGSAGGTGSVTVSRQTHTPGQTDVPDEPQYFMRWAVTVAPTGVIALTQPIEDVRTFAGKTAIVKFYAKAGAAKTVKARLDQNFGSGGSTAIIGTENNIVLSTSWQAYTFTETLGSISGKTI
ncbi:MAG: hypothetical protein KDA17_00940, partial [Candidatus Saccharibacteria bacterium]|nr:hypothetical protein [Candidatus Saccharibacteria bacterium]